MKINKLLVIPFAIAVSLSAPYVRSQDTTAIRYANTITEKDLREHLAIIASDALEGRDTGAPGQKMAATYIEEEFKSNQLTPIVRQRGMYSYFQKYYLSRTYPEEIWLASKDEKWVNLRDIYYEGNEQYPSARNLKAVFVGMGDKDVMLRMGINGKIVVGLLPPDQLGTDLQKVAFEAGALGVVIIVDTDQQTFQRLKAHRQRKVENPDLVFRNANPEMKCGQFLVPRDIGEKIFDLPIEKLKKASSRASKGNLKLIRKINVADLQSMITHKEQIIDSENVLGVVEGTDKKEEFIVITAHYDHVGHDDTGIFNGADDNGSGTVALMEIAEAFARAKKEGYGPRRSILFMTVSGEERGLLGSTWYTEHPVIPLKNTIANLNIDMIGRIDPEHSENSNYLYLIGTDKLSSELHELSERTNSTYTKIELDYRYNDENDPNRFYYRSDQYNFAKHGIPSIFYFNGTHPDYHRPTDTIEKINFPLLKTRSRLVFHTAWELAIREKRLQLD